MADPAAGRGASARAHSAPSAREDASGHEARWPALSLRSSITSFGMDFTASITRAGTTSAMRSMGENGLSLFWLGTSGRGPGANDPVRIRGKHPPTRIVTVSVAPVTDVHKTLAAILQRSFLRGNAPHLDQLIAMPACLALHRVTCLRASPSKQRDQQQAPVQCPQAEPFHGLLHSPSIPHAPHSGQEYCSTLVGFII